MDPLYASSDKFFFNHQKASASTLTVLENFTQSQIEDFYSAYFLTYSKLDGSYYSKEDFSKKFPDYYDLCYFQKGPQSQIVNAYLCNRKDNENGIKICLVFGEDTKEASAERIKILKELLHQEAANMYIEASGPLAAVLLKDSNIPISLVTEKDERSHYSTIKTRHGKKIMFGHPRNAKKISHTMKEFYFYLYEFNKIKLKEKEMSIDVLIKLLDGLFEKIEDSKIPVIYKSILLSKIAMKGKEKEVDSKEVKNQEDKVIAMLTHVNLTDLGTMDIFENGNVSSDQISFLEEMLSEKVDRLKGKFHLKA